MTPRGVGLFALLATAGQASAQTLGQAPDDGVSFWRVAGALLVCLALGVGAILLLRARGGAGPARPLFASLVHKERRLQLVEALRLNQHVDLCMVSCDGRILLLAASAQGVDMLPFPEAPAPRGAGAEERA